MKDQTTIRLELSGQTLEKFNAIKEYYGLTRSTEVLRRLISETYEKTHHYRIRGIPIESDCYEALETLARAQGYDSVDAYVDKILHNEMERLEQKPKEVVEHAEN